VTGVTKTSYSLFRLGVPVAINPVGYDIESLERKGVDGLLPGPVFGNWMDAITHLVDHLGSPSAPPNAQLIRSHFGLADSIDEKSPQLLFDGVQDWLRKAKA